MESPPKVLPNGDKERMRQLSTILLKWFMVWGELWPNHPISRLQQETYLHALSSLGPASLEIGCQEATKVCQYFPLPANILAASRRWEEIAWTRPSYLDQPKPIESMNEEDKQACEEYGRKLRSVLDKAAG